MSDPFAGPGSGPCVVDASTALKWVLQEEGSELAAALLDGRPLYAPALIFTEVANALWSAVRRQRLLAAEAADALDLIARAPLHQGVEDAALAPRALQLSLLLHGLGQALWEVGRQAQIDLRADMEEKGML